MKNKVEIGSCKKPHGIKGEFSFFLYSGSDSVLEKGMSVTLTPLSSASSLKKEGEEFIVERINFGNKVICSLKGVSDRNIVENMIPFSIHLDRDLFPESAEDEYYISDLLGLRALDESGLELGKVRDYYDNNAQMVLVIKGKEVIEVPFIEQFVHEVDLKKKVVVIRTPVILD